MKFYIFIVLFMSFVGCQSTQISLPAKPVRKPSSGLRCVNIFKVQARIKADLRFTKKLKAIEEVLNDKKTTQYAEELVNQSEVRRLAFVVQALTRQYRTIDLDKKDRKRMENLDQVVTALENNIGMYARQKGLLAYAKEAKLPQAQIDYIEQRTQMAWQQYLQAMAKSGWLPNPQKKITQLIKEIQKIDFAKPKKSEELLLSGLVDYFTATEMKISKLKPYIIKDRYSIEDLESGLHEMRRTLRWVMLNIQSLDGLLFYVSKDPNKSVADYLEAMGSSQKYVVLSPPDKGAVDIDFKWIEQLSFFVNKLGLLKDFKEAQLDLAQQLIDGGFFSEAKRQAAEEYAYQQLLPQFSVGKAEVLGPEFYRQYEEWQTLSGLISDIKEDL